MRYSAYAEQKATAAGITFVSCGHIFAKNGRKIFRPGGRDDWLIFYIAKGEEVFYLERETVAREGAFILFAPWECQHHQTVFEKTAEFYYAHFKCDGLPDGIALDTSRVYHAGPYRRICDLFEKMIDETLKKQPHYEQVCIYKLLELLTLLQRENEKENHPQRANLDRIALAVSYINRNYAENHTLADYAALSSMSPHHFLRVFFQITGATPIEYRNHIRLEHAQDLLLDGELSVEEIGLSLGYSSASYFSSAFKKKYGLSPKQYRQKHK